MGVKNCSWIDPVKTGNLIRMECEERGLSVRLLMEYLGIGAYQSIYNWYYGKTMPTLDNMVALSKLLNKPIEELIICQ